MSIRPKISSTENAVPTLNSSSKKDGKAACVSKDGTKAVTVLASPGHGPDVSQDISYTDTKVIGNGSFGVVYQARLCSTNDSIAIKKVLQDKRFKNRELQIMRMLEHQNIVQLMFFFYSTGDKEEDVYLNLVLEFVPETLYKLIKTNSRKGQVVSELHAKLYMYQVFRSLAYLHSLGICHRDIKPQNLLFDSLTGVVKLCDFGSAKQLVKGEPNVAYICSRYYRAPELIFGATDYTTQIDVWSAGCVLAELAIGEPIFPGNSGVDQLVEIIKVLGTPTREQIREMNPNYQEFKFPQIKAHPWSRVLRQRATLDMVDLVSVLFEYTPSRRICAIDACAHRYFDELRNSGTKFSSSQDLPPLFNFSAQELAIKPTLNEKLIPQHVRFANETATSHSSITVKSSAGQDSAASRH